MGTSGLQPYISKRHLAHTPPQRCSQLQKLSHAHRRQAKRPFVTVAVADSRSNAPQLPEGSFGLPFFGESREWLKDMPGFFADRYCHTCALLRPTARPHTRACLSQKAACLMCTADIRSMGQSSSHACLEKRLWLLRILCRFAGHMKAFVTARHCSVSPYTAQALTALHEQHNQPWTQRRTDCSNPSCSPSVAVAKQQSEHNTTCDNYFSIHCMCSTSIHV